MSPKAAPPLFCNPLFSYKIPTFPYLIEVIIIYFPR